MSAYSDDDGLGSTLDIEDLLDTLCNSIPEIVFLTDPDGIIVNINKAVEELGYAPLSPLEFTSIALF